LSIGIEHRQGVTLRSEGQDLGQASAIKRPYVELEGDVHRALKENASVKLDNEILKERRHILQRDCSEVCLD
jgi:hypothetical protein